MKLTDATVKSLKPRPRIYEAYDDEVKCFGVRVCPGGRTVSKASCPTFLKVMRSNSHACTSAYTE